MDLRAGLAHSPAPGAMTDAELAELPPPVARHLRAAIAAGTPLARSARLRMRGSIKIGRWLPFRAEELLSPQHGFLWSARVAGLIVGSDQYARGHGGMNWKLGGIVPLARAAGLDVSRSSAERAGAEGIWLPTSLLPRFGVEWSASDDSHISARYRTDGKPLQLDLELNSAAQIRSFTFQRWGDPDRTGIWAEYPCGGEVTGYGSFAGLTIPTAGRLGWFYGTERWPDGEFFRYRITDLQLVTKQP
jgi:hypothetical protein